MKKREFHFIVIGVIEDNKVEFEIEYKTKFTFPFGIEWDPYTEEWNEPSWDDETYSKVRTILDRLIYEHRQVVM